jgi:hypothetical protein
VIPQLAAPLRRLPIPLPPISRETWPSYLRRLARINHLDLEDLKDLVAIGKQGHGARATPRLDVRRLAVITGYSATRLELTLPDLQHTLRSPLVKPSRPACPRCVRRHRGGRVRIYLFGHEHVCVRHSIWLGTLGPANHGWSQPDEPIDVAAVPIIRMAQRRHHRLIHQHGVEATGHAMRSAVDAWDQMHHYRSLGPHDWERIRILRPGTDTIAEGNPLAQAVRYPEIVIIAGVLASPQWQAMATARREAAFAEIARRVALDGYSWQPQARHPLTYWANRQRTAPSPPF